MDDNAAVSDMDFFATLGILPVVLYEAAIVTASSPRSTLRKSLTLRTSVRPCTRI